MLKSPSLRVLLALALGLAAGALVVPRGGAAAQEIANVVEAVGGLWLNALRMTVIPLVFALVVTGVASLADAARAGGLVRRAVVLFAVLLFAAALCGVAAVTGLLALWPVEREAAAAFIAGAGAAGEAQAAPLSVGAWLQSLAPANPIRAAAEDAILPLTVFAVFFGFGASRLEPDLRAPLLGFFRAVAEALIVVVRWVLLAAPVGVFALSLGVGSSAGLGAAGVLAHYVAVVTLVTFLVTPAAIALAMLWGRVGPGQLGAVFGPPLAVAVATQSSIATLPAMLEAARDALRIPERVSALVLPLAVAVFRLTSPVANLAVAFFIAHLHGLSPGAPQIAAAVLAALAVSVSTVGLPGQASFFVSMAPICVALGAPLDLLAVLLAVEVIPDIFRTTGNVAADLAATAIVGKGESVESRA